MRTPDHGQCRRLAHDRGIVNRWPWPTLRDFLVEKLTRITPSCIDEMIAEKKFVTQDGVPITAMTTFEPQCFIFFHRDLPDEKPVPFPIGILYRDERILVVDKPHFLSSIPRGQHVLESVVVKLRTQLQMPELTVAHRLDRVTSGVLMLTCARQWRCPYQTLFERRQVRKTYRLVAPWLDLNEMDDGPLGATGDPSSGSAHDFGRLGEDETATSSDVAASRDSSATAFGDSAHDGDAISVTSQDHREQECSPEGRDDLFGQDTSESNCAGQYVKTKSNGLPHKDGDQPLTSGQRRDPSDPGDRAISVYPQLLDVSIDDFSRPLQLQAYRMSFVDPITGEQRMFTSQLELSCWPSTEASQPRGKDRGNAWIPGDA